MDQAAPAPTVLGGSRFQEAAHLSQVALLRRNARHKSAAASPSRGTPCGPTCSAGAGYSAGARCPAEPALPAAPPTAVAPACPEAPAKSPVRAAGLSSPQFTTARPMNVSMPIARAGRMKTIFENPLGRCGRQSCSAPRGRAVLQDLASFQSRPDRFRTTAQWPARPALQPYSREPLPCVRTGDPPACRRQCSASDAREVAAEPAFRVPARGTLLPARVDA